MTKRWVSIFLVIILMVPSSLPCSAEMKPRPEESKELMYQDMLMLFLLPHIENKIDEIYSDILAYSPEVYPYYVDITHVERVNGFRGFHFLITLEVVPTTGPHIVVGKDTLTLDISLKNPDNVKIVGWKHLKGPQEKDLPPNYKDILKK
ncbi:DUF3888 domain-containing protein [Paenibacillus antarcticus]|uniref:DUF3888 domain-containing protein n=1 Tax=Paenibacillus antarcticus TaxID=253703 RepID=A0A162LJ66_9BACL|nr:DUF3888 domain-containing protein [Paenibacillus antarcticus]OAB46774.1 hypothetical protein PBAT_08860 [Paenibacillus antarcticus]